MSIPGFSSCSRSRRATASIVNRSPSKALVVWYSQTEHTARIGRVIGHAWRKAGLTVDAADYREIDAKSTAGYDMIIVGTPVFYGDVPENLQKWMTGLPRLDGIAVASFVTFGGSGAGQRVTGNRLLATMAEKGAAPVGFEMFGNMSTWAPTWSTGNSARILKYRHLPNQETFARARAFAAEIVARVSAGTSVPTDTGFGLDTLMAGLPQEAGTKLFITDHHVDRETCIGCGTCVRKCPVAAINPGTGVVNGDRCIVCFGCINNCPTGAVRMNFTGKPVYGFNEFMKRNDIRIAEPPELNS